MRETRYFKVAEHIFCVSGETEVLALMENYEPFICDNGVAEFSVTIETGEKPDYSEEMRQEDDGQEIVCGHTDVGEAVFEFIWCGVKAGLLVSSADYHNGRLLMTCKYTKMAIDNALMIMFALATADKGTALFHAAVVSYEGHGYMFLGQSGTGKSTHARLWLRYIKGAELVNDDNPVVRLSGEGSAVVYGSPWSGKTPCYKNVSYRLGAIVGLSQAPYNKIRRLNGLEAYIILVPSISGKRWDKQIADGLHATENELVMRVPMWHLECLPDEEAAIKCNEAIAR